MDKNKFKTEKSIRRRKRTRAKISGTAKRPRLSVFKSNKYIYAQIIDDDKNQTLASASSVQMGKNCLVENAKKVGVELAKTAGAKKIKKVVFDKGGYIFTGRVQSLADGARKGGLKF